MKNSPASFVVINLEVHYTLGAGVAKHLSHDETFPLDGDPFEWFAI